MIRIKHKQTKEVQEISVYGWDQNIHHNHETWDVIAEYNLVQLFAWISKEKKWVLRHRMEKEDAMKIVRDCPNDYRFEDLPDTGNLFPIKTPKAYTKAKIIITQSISKYKNNIWVITIVGGIIVILVSTYIMIKLGWVKV